MRRRHLLVAVAGTSLALATDARADDALDAFLDKIKQSRDRLTTLQASFQQTRVIGLLATEVKSAGTLALVMPAQLRWDLQPPDDVTYWMGPKGLAMRNSEGVTKLGQSATGRFAAVLGDLMILLGGDVAKLRSRYAISRADATLTLAPKDERIAKHVKRIVLKVNAQLLVTTIGIVEKNGDRSSIVFGAYTKNAAIDPKRMKPPA